MQTVLTEGRLGGAAIDAVVKDLRQAIILILGERGTGKSTVAKCIAKRAMEVGSGTEIRVFDVSQSWFRRSPLPHRQPVTADRLKAGVIVNRANCVYEMGALPEDARRVFIGTVIGRMYSQRYKLKMEDPDAFDALPWSLFVFEEPDTYFGELLSPPKRRY